MDVKVQAQIAKIFAKNNHLNFEAMAGNTRSLVAYASAPFYLWAESLNPSPVAKSPDPIDGLLINLGTRVYGTVAAMLSLLAIGKPQDAEILSRTVMESAFSLLYVIEKNSKERLLQFFEIYIRGERKQNLGWEKSLADQSLELIADHQARILHKNNMLDVMENFLTVLSKEIGVEFPSKKTFPPSMAAIADALGRPIEYRTVYAAMCSQSHHDAEDVLNELMVAALESPEAAQNVENERDNFSVYLVCMAVRYFLECIEKLGHRYKFTAVSNQAVKSTEAVRELAVSVCTNDLTSSTKAWMPV